MHKNNAKSKKPCVHVISLGGTISCASKTSIAEFYDHPSININDLISSLPLVHDRFNISSEQLLQQISHEITDNHLIFIANKINELVKDKKIDGIVITQGTNAIEETAYFLNLVIKTKKPIVITGAIRPMNSLGFDGLRNLYNAIVLAASKTMEKTGVVLTFNDCITSARESSKSNPSTLEDFSVHGLALLGHIQGNTPVIFKLPQYKHTFLSEFDIQHIKKLTKIYIIYGHLGMDSSFVETAINNHVSGVISAGFGKGYQPQAVTEALIKARKKGIVVIRCSRTGLGMINKETKLDEKHGFIAGHSLNPQKARILLAVALNKTQNRSEIQRIFQEY